MLARHFDRRTSLRLVKILDHFFLMEDLHAPSVLFFQDLFARPFSRAYVAEPRREYRHKADKSPQRVLQAVAPTSPGG
jgi:hypothetical protein